MKESRVRVVLSFTLILSYLGLIFLVFYHEMNNQIPDHNNGDSMIGELKILIGVLTAGVAQVLNYWFGHRSKKDRLKES